MGCICLFYERMRFLSIFAISRQTAVWHGSHSSLMLIQWHNCSFCLLPQYRGFLDLEESLFLIIFSQHPPAQGCGALVLPLWLWLGVSFACLCPWVSRWGQPLFSWPSAVPPPPVLSPIWSGSSPPGPWRPRNLFPSPHTLRPLFCRGAWEGRVAGWVSCPSSGSAPKWMPGRSVASLVNPLVCGERTFWILAKAPSGYNVCQASLSLLIVPWI